MLVIITLEHTHTNRQTDTYTQRDTDTYRDTNRHTDSCISSSDSPPTLSFSVHTGHSYPGTHTNRQTDTYTERDTDTYRDTDRQTDTQTVVFLHLILLQLYPCLYVLVIVTLEHTCRDTDRHTDTDSCISSSDSPLVLSVSVCTGHSYPGTNTYLHCEPKNTRNIRHIFYNTWTILTNLSKVRHKVV